MERFILVLDIVDFRIFFQYRFLGNIFTQFIIMVLASANVYNISRLLLCLKKESSHSIELKAKPEYHKFLIGRGGANIRKVREKTGARVVFPVSGDADQESIMIMGKKEEVEGAKAELESLIQNLVSLVWSAQLSTFSRFNYF